MLIVEKNKEFTKFDSAVSLYHEYVVYITEPSDFFECFSEGLFLKILHEDFGEYRTNKSPLPLLKFAHKIGCYRRSK